MDRCGEVETGRCEGSPAGGRSRTGLMVWFCTDGRERRVTSKPENHPECALRDLSPPVGGSAYLRLGTVMVVSEFTAMGKPNEDPPCNSR